MQRSTERRIVAASSLLLSFSVLISCPSSFASDGGALAPVFGILKGPAKLVGGVLEGAGGVVEGPAKVVGGVLDVGGGVAEVVLGGNKSSKTNKVPKTAKSKFQDDADGVETASMIKSGAGQVSTPQLAPAIAAQDAPAQVSPRKHRSVGRDFPILQGEVSTYQPHTVVSQSINSLVDAALAKDERTVPLNKAVDKYSKLHSKIIASVGNQINFAVPNRGFEPSIEAGNVVTNESTKVKSLAAAELARQKQVDETHVKVVASIMQMAMGMGMSDRVKGQQKVNDEYSRLRELVGEEQANSTMNSMLQWSTHPQIKEQETAFNKDVWDVNEQRDKKLTIMTTALNSDPVVADVLSRIHKYNHKSKFARVSGRVVQTTLATIALGPDFVGAGGKIALSVFVGATGGPEQDKIMKELYLGERLDSRSNVLNSEIQLAMENYQIGKLTRNAVLMAAAEAVVQQMAGPEVLPDIFGRTPETSSNTLPINSFAK
jgi:hypothetical protein